MQSAVRSPTRMSIDDLEPLFKLSGITWINLQYDECGDELAEALEKYGVTIHNWEDLDQKDDLDQTAAMTSLLDLAIGIAAPIVMACNLGIPVIRWEANSTMAQQGRVLRSQLHYPSLIFSRHYQQSKTDLAREIAEYIDKHYLS